jgi:hypothetical protein
MDCDPAVGEVAECLGRSLHIQQDDEVFSLPVSECVCVCLNFELKDITVNEMLQSARNLVSAMKGGRGPRKLSVKWAPEVYDPIPTSVSHTLTKKQQQRGGKNNKKKKCRDRDKDKAKKKQSRKKERHNDVTNSSSHCGSSLIINVTNYSLAL